jgi:type VI secretion system secreted protein Hcp
MSFNSYVSFKGKKQGQFKGSASNSGSTDKWSQVVAFSMGGMIAIDSPSEAAKGARKHKPIVITREVDSSSPQLLQAYWSNEVLDEVVLEIKSPHSPGLVIERLTLGNAVLSKIRMQTPAYALQHHSEHSGNELETIEFTYQRIAVTNLNGGKSASDDWATG